MASSGRTRQARNLVTLLRRTGVRPRHVILPVVFSLISAALTSIGLGLLIPLANGLASQDYSTALDTPVLGGLVRALADETDGRQVLLVLVGAVFVVNIAGFFLRYLFGLYLRYWQGVFALNISDHVFGRLLGLSRAYYDATSQGSATQVVSFSESVLKALTLIQDVLASAFQLLARFAVMVVISWPVSLCALLVYPIMSAAVGWLRGRIQRLSRQRTEARLELARDVFNMLSSIDLIKAYGHEGPVRERYRGSRDTIRRLEFRASLWSDLVLPIQDTIVLLALLGLIVAATFTIPSADTGRIAEFVVLFYVARSALPHLARISRARFDLMPLVPELKKIWNVLEQTENYVVPSGTREFPGLHDAIEIDGLSFDYGDGHPVLRGLQLRIPRGRTVALVGATGSGKSTLVKLLLRFYDCPPGTIRFDGVDIRDLAHGSLRRHLDYVSQDVLLFNDTVRANLTFGLQRECSDDELWEVLERVRLAATIRVHQGGLDAAIGDRGLKLSGGERQRLAIARSMARRASILILDEATSALDGETERHVSEQLKTAVGERTTVMIAHRLTTVRDADVIGVLQAGAIVELGSWDELMRRGGPFREMWDAYHRSDAAEPARSPA